MPHHMVDAGRNRVVCGGRSNAVGGVGGGSDVVFKVIGRFDVSSVGFKVDVA